MRTAPSVAEVVGANAQDIRGRTRIDDVAREARQLGLKWNSGRISDLERGRVSPTLSTLYVLANALSRATGRDVSLADLVRTPGYVRLNDHLVIRGTALVSALSGEAALLDDADRYLDAREVAEAIRATTPSERIAFTNELRATSEAEQKLARALGVSLADLLKTTRQLWDGRSLTEERDRRAGPDANAQKRGRVSRELKAELRERLHDGDD